MSAAQAAPGFGEADLSNCEREQIHLAGSIQPHGALLLLREPDHVVVQTSANAPDFLSLGRDAIGLTLTDLGGDFGTSIAAALAGRVGEIPVAIRCRDAAGVALDCLLHRAPGGGIIVEVERAGPVVDLSAHLENGLKTIVRAGSIRTLSDETARFFKALTGYDRVMVYRFDEDGHGQVLAEQRRPDLEAFLGNRYPATDIPQIARRLYERNRVRVLVDVDATPSPLHPRRSPLTDADLDMSLCFLRSMSPVHIQYLKNMGVGATLVVSLMAGNRLWGLIACHHYEPRFVHFETRSVCELLAEAVGTRIAALESFAQAQAELSVRRLEQRMIESISREGDWRSALFDRSPTLLQPVGATGAALFFDGEIATTGEVPGTAELRRIAAWIGSQKQDGLVVTKSLGAAEPDLAGLTATASGLVATPVSSTPGEYLVWFRPEQVRTITWGGNPNKAMVIGNDPADLSPRRSFAQWHQLVEGTSEPWSEADLTAARLIGDSVTDVVLQFRSVRVLLAQDQLEQVKSQIRASQQPVLVADEHGRVLMSNEALKALIGTHADDLEWLEELALVFTEAAQIRHDLHDLPRARKTWRRETGLETETGEVRPLLLRADPVFAAPDRLLGFVLHFTDLTERRAAATARRRLQANIMESHRQDTLRLGPEADLLYRELLAPVMENAQLAALEVTDGVDTGRIRGMLDSIRASLVRAAEILEHLVEHATRTTDAGTPAAPAKRAGKPRQPDDSDPSRTRH